MLTGGDMKQLQGIFGRTIVAGIIFVFIIYFITSVSIKGRTGLYDILAGEFKDRTNIEENAFADGETDAFIAHTNRKQPTLIFCSHGLDGEATGIRAHNVVQLKDYFKGTDADGNSVMELNITEITDCDGNSILDSYDTATGTILFNNAGIYTITCQLKDATSVEAIRKIDFPVDN